MDNKAKVTGLVLAGYLLGRTKKLKLALTVAGALGGKQLMNNKDELAAQVTKLVQSSPEARRLVEQVSGRLVEAAKGAAIAGASKRIESVSNTLQSRAERLNAMQQGVGEAAGRTAEAGMAAAGAAGTGAGAVGAGAGRGLRSVTHPFKSRAERRQAVEDTESAGTSPEEEAGQEETPAAAGREETEERPEGEAPEEEYAEEERPEGGAAEEERPEGGAAEEERPEGGAAEEERP
ncbi:hypothetical protein ACFQ36_15565, partial [Arthrobacter sp. GCM10027362]|uniref:hypothetical protein n=1 Tax=Arthrobacter sp. GCM10027362 TaxID=3273379 RepID=UPI00364229B8